MNKSFTYRATNPDGEIFDGSMDASEEALVVSKLQDLGLIPIRVAVKDGPEEDRASGVYGLIFQKVSGKEVLNFTKEMSSLLRSGIALDRGLRILINTVGPGKEFARVLKEILSDVEGGKALADALARHPGVFSRLYVKMIWSGESSGSLETIMERLAEFLESSQATKGEIKSALVYPVFLTFVSGVSIVVLLLFVIPRFASTFANIGVELPISTALLLGVSRIVVRYWWLMLFLLLMGALGCRYYIKTPSGNYVWDNLKLRLPIIGGLIQRIEVARFTRTLGTILNGGVPILESLGIVKDIATNRVMVDTIGELQVKVKRGESIGGSLKGNSFVPSMAVEMITVGEETGRLPDILIEVADSFDRQTREHMKRLLSLLEPSLILFMGLVVGAIVISMLLAIFSINEIPF